MVQEQHVFRVLFLLVLSVCGLQAVGHREWWFYACRTWMIVICFLGNFQIYRWVADRQIRKRNEIPNFREYAWPVGIVDKCIPFHPAWVYVYGLLFFVLYGLVILLITNDRIFLQSLVGGCFVLLVQAALWILIPTTIPYALRQLKKTNKGKRLGSEFLDLVQGMDGQNTNAIPSQHCSLSTHLACTLYFYTSLPPLLLVLIPILIAVSCVGTKQHVFLDTVCGIALGFFISIFLIYMNE